MNFHTVTILNDYELDDLVNYNWVAWNNSFRSVSLFNWKKDSDHCVLGVAPVKTKGDFDDRYDLQAYSEYQAWKSGQFPHASVLSRLLDSLCTDGLLQHGNYLIRVSW